MLTPSPWQRLLYFLVPLVVGGLLLWIPLRDALETGLPAEETVAVNVPEGHHWVAFTVEDDPVYATDGATITVHAGFRTAQGTISEDNRTLLFDLEDVKAVDEVMIEWPDGREQRFKDVELNVVHDLRYPRTADDALRAQWQVRGPFYRFWGWAGVGILLILFALRVLSWAEHQGQHAA